MNWEKIIPYFIIVLLLGCMFYQCKNPTIKEKVVTVEKVDTVVITEIKTDTMWLTDIQYKDRFIIDTIYVNNPDIEIEDKDTSTVYHYTDSIININLQAKQLDWLQYNLYKKDRITYYKTNTEFIYKTKKPRFYYGVGVGAGYGFIHNQFDIFVGVNAGLEF